MQDLGFRVYATGGLLLLLLALLAVLMELRGTLAAKDVLLPPHPVVAALGLLRPSLLAVAPRLVLTLGLAIVRRVPLLTGVGPTPRLGPMGLGFRAY